MANAIIVPRLGWSMDEGIFGQWLKQAGELVLEGDSLFELESDKATQEVESFDSGILRIPDDAPQPGDVVKVGQCLGYLCGAEESAPNACSAGNDAANPVGNGHSVADEDVLAAAKAKDPRSPGESGQGFAESRQIAVSPRAAARAAQLGVSIARITGSGRGGRIRERDVLAAVRPHSKQPTELHDPTQPTPAPISGVATDASAAGGRSVHSASTRHPIAERMLAATQQTAQVTLMVKADATELKNLREDFKRVFELTNAPVPSVTSLFVKLVAVALQQHPEMLHQWADEGLRRPESIHLAVAVDTPRGLLAPVLRDITSLPLGEVAKRVASMVERARAGQLTPEDLQGGTFTLSNLGSYAVDGFTPILNLPQSAILGIGRIRREPTVVGDEIVIRDQVSLSLTFDHRVHDGAPSAAFLQTLCQILEHPGVWLMT